MTANARQTCVKHCPVPVHGCMRRTTPVMLEHMMCAHDLSRQLYALFQCLCVLCSTGYTTVCFGACHILDLYMHNCTRRCCLCGTIAMTRLPMICRPPRVGQFQRVDPTLFPQSHLGQVPCLLCAGCVRWTQTYPETVLRVD